MKAFLQEKAAASWSWVNEVPRGLVGFIGLVELIGAAGLILPQMLVISPVLTPIVAIGLVVTALLGVLFHVGRKEYGDNGIGLAFLALAMFIAIGRL